MANDISSRTWKIDTPSVAPAVTYQPQVYIKFIEIVGGAAGSLGGSMATIADRNNKPIIQPLYQTTNAGEIQTYNLENWFEGLNVTALGTGVVLQVHVK